MKHSHNFNNLIGQTFSRLTVKSYKGKDKHRHSVWLCICECGARCPVATGDLTTGNTKSCGCLNLELTTERCKTMSSTTHGRTYTPEFSSWGAMLQRCTNPNCTGWKTYGGATPPVLICPEWTAFEGFFASVGERPEGTSLGRFLDRGNYEPGNACWMTKAEQNLSRRNNTALRKWAM